MSAPKEKMDIGVTECSARNNLSNTSSAQEFSGPPLARFPCVREDVPLGYPTIPRNGAPSTWKNSVRGSFEEDIIASETANNAAIGGALIPMLSLAIPGSPPSAVLLGALQLHGIRPGPMLTFDQPEFIPYMAALMLLASFMMRFSGWGICQIAPKILRVPFFILMPVVGVLSIIGAYALNVNMFDLTIMFIFGIIGYIFMKLQIPAAPIVLGLILGGMADSNFRRALQASQGGFTPFRDQTAFNHCPSPTVFLLRSSARPLCMQGLSRSFKERIKPIDY